MAKQVIFYLFFLHFFILNCFCQTNNLPQLDSLQKSIVELEQQVQAINLNLASSKKRLKAGIIVSTVGYTVTIIGGQLLGGPDNDLGEVLLFAGGGIGIGGTYLIYDGFSLLSRKKMKKKPF